MENERIDTNLGMSRRTLLRRGAIVGGTLVWAAPAVQTFARPAFAAGSEACSLTFTTETSEGTCIRTTFPNQSPDCCDCIDEQKASGANAFVAAVTCIGSGRCNADDPSTTSC